MPKAPPRTSSQAALKITALALAALRSGAESPATHLYTAVVIRPILGRTLFGASLARLFIFVPDDFVATARLALPRLAIFLKHFLIPER